MTWRRGRSGPRRVIDINRLADLRGIQYEPDRGLSIGATTRIEEIERSAEIRDRYFSLHQAAREIGSPQVRAMATLGGNSCTASPCADTPPPLVTFGTTVTLASRSGRREMPLEAFIRNNRMTAIRSEEYLERFHLPEPWPHSASRYATLTLRAAVEIDIASLAVNLAMEPQSGTVAEVRIAMGAVAPVPLRARQAEEILRGQEPTAEIIARAAAELRRGEQADRRSSGLRRLSPARDPYPGGPDPVRGGGRLREGPAAPAAGRKRLGEMKQLIQLTINGIDYDTVVSPEDLLTTSCAEARADRHQEGLRPG